MTAHPRDTPESATPVYKACCVGRDTPKGFEHNALCTNRAPSSPRNEPRRLREAIELVQRERQSCRHMDDPNVLTWAWLEDYLTERTASPSSPVAPAETTQCQWCTQRIAIGQVHVCPMQATPFIPTAPAQDTETREKGGAWYHQRAGWYFRRLRDGSVEVRPPQGVHHKILPEEWASVVAFVSAQSDASVGFSLATDLHKGLGALTPKSGDVIEPPSSPAPAAASEEPQPEIEKLVRELPELTRIAKETQQRLAQAGIVSQKDLQFFVGLVEEAAQNEVSGEARDPAPQDLIPYLGFLRAILSAFSKMQERIAGWEKSYWQYSEVVSRQYDEAQDEIASLRERNKELERERDETYGVVCEIAKRLGYTIIRESAVIRPAAMSIIKPSELAQWVEARVSGAEELREENARLSAELSSLKAPVDDEKWRNAVSDLIREIASGTRTADFTSPALDRLDSLYRQEREKALTPEEATAVLHTEAGRGKPDRATFEALSRGLDKLRAIAALRSNTQEAKKNA